MEIEIEPFSAKIIPLLSESVELEQVATGFRFTEGPLWDPRGGALYFSDILANRLYRWTEAGGAEVFREPSLKSNGLTWGLDGRLLACEHVGRRVSRTLDDGSVEPVVEYYGGKRLNSPNDLVLRSDGLLYFSDPPYGLTAEFGAVAEQEQPLSGLYLLRPGEREPVLVADDFDRPNGLAFSPDEKTLYVSDTPRYLIRRFKVAKDGALSAGEVFAHLDPAAGEGRPDGLKVDREGNVYATGPGAYGSWRRRASSSPTCASRRRRRTAAGAARTTARSLSRHPPPFTPCRSWCRGSRPRAPPPASARVKAG